jgi:glycerol-3-phosphate O-acyltransferase
MGAMQSRPPQPSQASLFDAPPAPETPSEGAAPATDGADGVPAVEADPLPSLPLPGFLAVPDPAPAEADAAVGVGAGIDPVTPGLDIDPAPPKAKRPLWARILGRIVDPWLKLDIEPGDPDQFRQFDDGRPVCYVLEDYGLSNALILERACREAGLPSPLQPIPGDPLGRKRSYVALSRRHANALLSLGLVPGPEHKTHSGSLARLLEAHRANAALDVQLVPVSIFVGQAPNRSSGWFSVLFSENWAIVGRFRRLLAILLNGRDTLVQFAPPVSLRDIVAEDLPPERTVRKLSRVLRTHFRRLREVVVGPDLSTRRMLVDKVLAAEPVREAIADQAKRDKTKPMTAWQKAHAYAYEIAADYSHTGGALGQLPADRCVEPDLPRRAGPAPGRTQGRRARARNRLRALAPQPHGLPAAELPAVHPRHGAAAHLRRHQPQPAGGRHPAAQGRRVLRPPQFPRQCAVRGGVPRIHGAADRRRLLDRILHRRRALAHRPPAAAQGRHRWR